MESITPTHCLDACAIIAYLRNEPGAEILKDLIELPDTLLAMHVCNLGEVYYDFFRSDGLEAAQTAWENALALPLTLCRDIDDLFVQRVGIIKVEERVSFADAFALALAERLSVPLITTDHHEFDPVEQKGHFAFSGCVKPRSNSLDEIKWNLGGNSCMPPMYSASFPGFRGASSRLRYSRPCRAYTPASSLTAARERFLLNLKNSGWAAAAEA